MKQTTRLPRHCLAMRLFALYINGGEQSKASASHVLIAAVTAVEKEDERAYVAAGSAPKNAILSSAAVKKPGAPTLSDRGQGRLRCPLCSKRFSQHKTHKAHVQRHRQKDSGLFKCPRCDKRLVQRSSLITHLRIHTGERPFPCEDCPALFSDRSSYKKHRRTHSGEKPYQCAVCRRSFSQSGNLKRHTRKLHASSPL